MMKKPACAVRRHIYFVLNTVGNEPSWQTGWGARGRKLSPVGLCPAIIPSAQGAVKLDELTEGATAPPRSGMGARRVGDCRTLALQESARGCNLPRGAVYNNRIKNSTVGWKWLFLNMHGLLGK